MDWAVRGRGAEFFLQRKKSFRRTFLVPRSQQIVLHATELIVDSFHGQWKILSIQNRPRHHMCRGKCSCKTKILINSIFHHFQVTLLSMGGVTLVTWKWWIHPPTPPPGPPLLHALAAQLTRSTHPPPHCMRSQRFWTPTRPPCGPALHALSPRLRPVIWELKHIFHHDFQVTLLSMGGVTLATLNPMEQETTVADLHTQYKLVAGDPSSRFRLALTSSRTTSSQHEHSAEEYRALASATLSPQLLLKDLPGKFTQQIKHVSLTVIVLPAVAGIVFLPGALDFRTLSIDVATRWRNALRKLRDEAHFAKRVYYLCEQDLPIGVNPRAALELRLCCNKVKRLSW